MLETWRQLLAEPALMHEAAAADAADVAAVARLRKRWPAALVKAALDLARARRKAAEKFDEHAGELLADVGGIEQASSVDIAVHKARRFVESCGRGSPVMDLCCGIGGDAMGLGAVCDVRVIDLDPARVFMARHNVRVIAGRECPGAAADVTTLNLHATPFHIDPSRRAAGKRLHDYADYQPGPAFLEDLIARCGDGAIKLGPGVDTAALPPGEVEFISRRGILVQAVLWTGRLQRHDRSATSFPSGATLTGSPAAGNLRLAPPGAFLHAVDPAVERADLMGALGEKLGAGAVHPALGLLTSEEAIDDPFVTSFRLLDRIPFRPEKVKGWLAAHDGGIVEVKTRGKACDPDEVSRTLRGEGETIHTVFVLRFEQRVEAWITQRVPRPDRPRHC